MEWTNSLDAYRFTDLSVATSPNDFLNDNWGKMRIMGVFLIICHYPLLTEDNQGNLSKTHPNPQTMD
jgi:hypothetical protein